MIAIGGRRPRRPTAVAAALGLVCSAATVVSVPGAAAAPVLSPGARGSAPSATARGSAAGSALPAGVPHSGSYGFLLKLDTTSTGAAFVDNRARGKAVASRAARVQLSRVNAAQNAVIADLPRGETVLYRMHAVLAGVGVYGNVHNYAALTRIRGVQAVYPITPKSIADITSGVQFEGGATAWALTGRTGQGMRIGIIDTGIDYTHADLGGDQGYTYADAEAHANDKDLTWSGFPTRKVAGGYDFAGDAYTGSNAAQPDANPLDCASTSGSAGHGTHVAGIAAGVGENSDGSTYTGSYDNSTPFQSMKINPGMAPGATLYAYKVFGCSGTTDLVAAAIDRSADPDNNGDTSDHLNVDNISISSPYSSPEDADGIAAAAAIGKGVTIVSSAGNFGDSYDIGGSPANEPGVLAVASSQDAESVLDATNLTIDAGSPTDYPSSRSTAFPWADDSLTGTVVAAPSSPDGCTPISDTVTGDVVFVTWTRADVDNGVTCSAAEVATNVAAAGGTGFIIGYDQETLDSPITGSATVPGVIVAKSATDAISAALHASPSQPVTVNGTTAQTIKQELPGNDDLISGFSARGVGAAGNVKPDVTAVGQSVFSAASGTGDGGQSLNGTSMASPMVAGEAALVAQVNPTWRPEQIKADIMNTADHDVYTDSTKQQNYGPNRVGAGRIDAELAIGNSVLAYNADDPGSVSASFGPVEVAGTATITKTKHITVDNTGTSPATYGAAYVPITAVPGVSDTVTPSAVTVPAGGTQTLTLTLTIDPTRLAKTQDPTVAPTQVDPTQQPPQDVARQFLADASGRIELTSTSDPNAPVLRVPVYAAPRPASTMTQPASLTLPSGAVQQALLPLSGQQVDQGSGATAVQSLTAGFELTATSGLAPVCTGAGQQECVAGSDDRAADLKYVGVTSDAPQLAANKQDPLIDGLLYFAVSAQAPWSAPAETRYEVWIDVNPAAHDGADFVAFNTQVPGTDIYETELVDVRGARPVVVGTEPLNDASGDVDTALYNSDTMVLPVSLAELGITQAQRVAYGVASYGNLQAGPVDAVGLNSAGDPDGSLTIDPLHPGVTVAGSYDGSASPLLFRDTPGAVLQVRRDASTYGPDHGKGVLIVHFQNLTGQKAQVLSIKNQVRPGLAFTPGSVTQGGTTSVRITVAGAGGVPATGTVRLVRTSGAKAPITALTGRLTNGAVTLKYPVNLASGRYNYQVSYSGDANYVATTSATTSLTVTQAKVTAKPTFSFNPGSVKRGAYTSVTIHVAPAGTHAATGTVRLVRLSGPRAPITSMNGTLRNGTVTLHYPTGGLAPGMYKYQIAYVGDAYHVATKSNGRFFTVAR